MKKTNILINNAVVAKALGIGYVKQTIIRDINFNLKPGNVLALVGSNGSGKTTLLKTIAGLLQPTMGSITVLNNAPLSQPDKISYLSQFHVSSFMLPLKTYDIIRMSRFATHGLFGKMTEDDERAIQHAIKVMEINQLINIPLNSLSGGQQQKVFLAQTFAKEADLILLDEPAANLDLNARKIYRKYIRELAKKGKTIVLTTHDISEAAECDLVMLLANRVVAYGNSTEIFTKNTLLDTFGLVGNWQNDNLIIIEREHSH